MTKLKLSNNYSNQSSLYVRRNSTLIGYDDSESWVILTPIERQIKEKIERIGTPLKDWNISINYGIKTGYNRAFIIDGIKRKELIDKDPKSAEIIRPLLRGRDIKRYSYKFADLYIITTFPSLKINIEDYPAVKQHLMSYGYERLKQTGDKGSRKRTRNKWYETQDSINYWEDFFRLKIIYPNMTKFLPFVLDDNSFLTNQKCFIITGENVEFLAAFLNSSLFKYCFRDNFPELQGGTRELSKVFFERIPVLRVSSETNQLFSRFVRDVQNLISKDRSTKEVELKIDNHVFDLYGLTSKEKEEIGFIEIQ